MNHKQFKEDVHSCFNNVYITYMNDVEVHCLELESKSFNLDEYYKIDEFRTTFDKNIKKELDAYLLDINSSEILEEEKEKARQILHDSQSVFHVAGFKLYLNIKNRFDKSPDNKEG